MPYNTSRSSSFRKSDGLFDMEGSDMKKYLPMVVTLVAIVLVNLPQTYDLTQSLVAKIGLFDIVKDGRPTILGVIIHALVALLLIFLADRYLLKKM